MCAVCARELASIFQSLLKQQRSGAPPPRPSREPGFPATPTRTPTHPGRRHPSLSALYLQHQREKPGAQAQCEPPQSGAGWGGEGAGAAAPSRPAKWQERQISLISGQLWCTRTPGSRPLPFSPRSLEKASFFLYSAVRTGAFIPLRGNMVQCARSPPRLC